MARWEEIARRKRDSIDTLIPEQWRIAMIGSPLQIPDATIEITRYISNVEKAITEMDAAGLLAAIRAGDLTVQEVVIAFCHRASIAHQLTNCLAEINFQEALVRAKELDKHQRERHGVVGPLHGLPVSVTDRYDVRGLESSCGFISWLGTHKQVEDEGLLIQRLTQLGAVVFCKTNVPMSMMCGDTTNNVMGSTLNAFNRNLTAGGACGGEGSLLALKGSPLGWATDVAGSSRIPCAFQGLYSLKVSEGRLPANGVETVLQGLPIASGAVGIMSSSVDSLILAFRAIIGSAPWEDDLGVLELPWREEKAHAIQRRKCGHGDTDGRLVFGIMSTDDHVRPLPAVQRALRTVKQALARRGYELIDWKPPPHNSAVEVLFRIFGATAGKAIRDAINASGEPPIAQIKEWYEQGATMAASTLEFWEFCNQIHDYRKEYWRYWTATGAKTLSGRPVDGVILPVCPTTAMREGEFKYFAYSAIVNVLDYCAATFPVTRGDMLIDVQERDFKARNDMEAIVSETSRKDDVHGLPVGLQVMCPKNQEERALMMLEAIDEALMMEGMR